MNAQKSREIRKLSKSIWADMSLKQRKSWGLDIQDFKFVHGKSKGQGTIEFAGTHKNDPFKRFYRNVKRSYTKNKGLSFDFGSIATN